jgi:hypothetical protein
MVKTFVSLPSGHAVYCNLWPVWLCHICPHYLINGSILGNKLLSKKCVF